MKTENKTLKFQIDIVDFDDDKRIYLKSPNRYVLGLALAKNDSNPVESKEIVINNRNETSVKGIFAAGDVTNVPFKQIIISAGEGAKAALFATEYLSEKN